MALRLPVEEEIVSFILGLDFSKHETAKVVLFAVFQNTSKHIIYASVLVCKILIYMHISGVCTTYVDASY